MARCVALLSGGLDSMLAVRLMQEQGIAVEGLNFKTIFTCCQDQAGQSARDLGIRVTVVGQEPDYIDLVRAPRFGYGRGANPCVDCRIYMFQKAKIFMEQCDAQFVVSGEIVGQRPMSQKRRDLEVISYHSELDDRLLRPLSARLLPPTRPEREGIVDRERLYDFSGRSRKGLIKLAKSLGISEIPSPSTGCALTEPRFSRKVFDLIEHEPNGDVWNYDLLKYGRHFRCDDDTKIVVGRHESDNQMLKLMHRSPHESDTILVSPRGFPGPRVLIVGPATDATFEIAASLLLRYAHRSATKGLEVEVDRGGNMLYRMIRSTVDVDQLETLATIES